MLKQCPPVDGLFKALADPARREMVERLSLGPASVSQLAAPLNMTMSAVVQHLAVLHDCGLVRSEKIGRIRTCRIEPATLSQAEAWFSGQRNRWEHRLDRLADVVADEKVHTTKEEIHD